MTGYFLDTSALLKLYHFELGTPVVQALFDDSGAARYISRLSVLEAQSGLMRRVREGVVSRETFQHYRDRFFLDIEEQRVVVCRTPSHYLRTAERLLLQYGTQFRLRTLDALQLAVATDHLKRGGIDHFVAADNVLCEVAKLEGFTVLNPQSATP